VPFYWDASGFEQVQVLRFAYLVRYLSEEYPTVAASGSKVFVLYPKAVFVRVSSF
jgi:hypothetical protein